MPAYLTATEARSWLDTADDIYGAGADTAIEADIDAVEGIAERYLAERYTVPLTDAADLEFMDGIIKSLWHHTALRRSSIAEVPQPVRDAYKDAMQLLKDIRDGLLTLPSGDVNDDATNSVYFGRTPQVTSTDLEGY